MTRLLHSAAALTAAVVLAGCAAVNVGSYVERGLDLTKYRTYDWGPADALPTGDPRLDANPFFHDYLQGGVEKNLAGKKLVRATANPDLLLHYHASVTRELNVQAIERELTATGERPRVVEYDAGTIILDIVDARTNTLLWRGWSKGRLSGIIENQDLMRQHVTEAVEGMLKQLPPTF